MKRFKITTTFDESKSLKFYAKIIDNATSMRFENCYDNMEALADWIAHTLKHLEKGKPSNK